MVELVKWSVGCISPSVRLDVLCEVELLAIYESVTYKWVKCNHFNVHRTLMTWKKVSKKIYIFYYISYTIIKSKLNICIRLNPTVKQYFLYINNMLTGNWWMYPSREHYECANTRCLDLCLYTKNNATSGNHINNTQSYIINNSATKQFQLNLHLLFHKEDLGVYSSCAVCIGLQLCSSWAASFSLGHSLDQLQLGVCQAVICLPRLQDRKSREKKSRAFQCGKDDCMRSGSGIAFGNLGMHGHINMKLQIQL